MRIRLPTSLAVALLLAIAIALPARAGETAAKEQTQKLQVVFYYLPG